MRTAVVIAAVAGWVILGGLGADIAQAGAQVVPIPSSLLMLGVGLAALVTHRRRSR